MMPRVGCLYASDLPAWTHTQLHGRTRHLAVIERSRVAGASRAARRVGVAVGMSADRARALLPEEATVAPRRKEQEAAAWEALCTQVNGFTPRLEGPRPGLLYLEPREDADVRRLAADLALQGAIAPDRPAALLGAVRAAPGHVLTITAAKRGAFLARYPTRLLTRLGFEDELTERLDLFGFEHLGPMRRLTERHLTAQFGEEEGTRLYDLLHPGRAERVAYYQAPPTISVAYDIEEWPRDIQPVRLALEETVRRAAAELKGRRTQRLTVTMEQRGAEVLRQVRVLREPTAAACRLSRLAVRLLEEIAQREAFAEAGGPAALVRLDVEFGHLRRPEVRQGALFARRPGLKAAIKAVCRRFPGALLGCRLRPHALFPEERSALVPLGISQEK